MTAPITPDDLDAVVAAVWESLTGAPAVPTATAPPLTRDAVVATLTISGPDPVRVRVTVPDHAAGPLAAALLGTPDGQEPTAADVDDAVGEIANIVAGNVKALLPEPSTLSLPRVSALSAENNPEPDTLLAAYVSPFGVFTVALSPRGE